LIVATVLIVMAAVIAGLAVGHRLAGETKQAGPASTTVIRFTADQQLVYRLNFSSAGVSNVGAIFSDANPQAATPSLLELGNVFETTVQGELAITVLEADAKHTLLAIEFHNPKVEFQSYGVEDAAQSQRIQSGLAQPLFCALNAQGAVQLVWFNSAAHAVAQPMICSLLATMQMVKPESEAAAADTWEAEEEDPNGKLVAHYEMQPDGTIHKTKLHYLPPKPAKKTTTTQLTPTIQSTGEDVAELDAEGNLAVLAATEAQSISFQNKDVGHGILKIDLRLERKNEAAASDLTRLRTSANELLKTDHAISLYAPLSPEESNRVVQREALGSATLESLLAELAAAERETPSEKQITQLFLKLKALAVVHPEACDRLGKLLTGAKTGSLRMQILTDALETAGNAPAQAALCAAILTRSADVNAMRLLIPALGSVETPTPQTAETLELLAFGDVDNMVKAAARLALGAVARSVAGDSPAITVKIVDRLVQELKTAPPARAWELLLALGNAGSSESLPTLKEFQKNPEPNLRGTAAWATRWIDSPEVVPLLAKVLQEEPEAAVRLEAVRALQYRQKTPANIAVEEKSLADSDAQVRMELLTNLWTAREAYPETKQLVEKAARNDPSEDVRKAATKLLKDAQAQQ
jgi:hypothetical protein